jgi:hypothetical protein
MGSIMFKGQGNVCLTERQAGEAKRRQSKGFSYVQGNGHAPRPGGKESSRELVATQENHTKHLHKHQNTSRPARFMFLQQRA